MSMDPAAAATFARHIKAALLHLRAAEVVAEAAGVDLDVRGEMQDLARAAYAAVGDLDICARPAHRPTRCRPAHRAPRGRAGRPQRQCRQTFVCRHWPRTRRPRASHRATSALLSHPQVSDHGRGVASSHALSRSPI